MKILNFFPETRWSTQYIELKTISQQQLEQLDIQQDNITSQTRLLIRIVWIFSYTITSALFSRIIQIAVNCCVVQFTDVFQNLRQFDSISSLAFMIKDLWICWAKYQKPDIQKLSAFFKHVRHFFKHVRQFFKQVRQTFKQVRHFFKLLQNV